MVTVNSYLNNDIPGSAGLHREWSNGCNYIYARLVFQLFMYIPTAFFIIFARQNSASALFHRH